MLNTQPNESVQAVEYMQHCITLTKQVSSHQEAGDKYQQLRDRLVKQDSDLAAVMDLMWQELLASRRSAFFWEELCHAEQQLNEQMTSSHVQLRQNYLRLMQEQ